MSFFAEINKIPRVTRYLVLGVTGVSVPLMMKVVSPYPFLFVPSLVFKKLQLWRIVSSFLVGGSGIGFLFDIIMLYRNSSELESTQFRSRSADYLWQLVLASSALVTIGRPLNTYVHYRPLLVMLTYLASYVAPDGSTTSLFGLISVPVKAFPYFLVAMDFLSGGPGGAAQAISGCIIGHLWWWVVFERRGAAGGHGGGRFGTAPRWLTNVFNEEPTPASTHGNAQGGPTRASVGGVYAVPGRSRAKAGEPVTGHQWGSGGNKLGR